MLKYFYSGDGHSYRTFKTVRYTFQIFDSDNSEVEKGGGKINVEESSLEKCVSDERCENEYIKTLIDEKIRNHKNIPENNKISITIGEGTTQKLYKNNNLKKKLYKTGIYTGLVIGGVIIGRAIYNNNDTV